MLILYFEVRFQNDVAVQLIASCMVELYNILSDNEQDREDEIQKIPHGMADCNYFSAIAA